RGARRSRPDRVDPPLLPSDAAGALADARPLHPHGHHLLAPRAHLHAPVLRVLRERADGPHGAAERREHRQRRGELSPPLRLARDPLLRPARAKGSLRPAARRGGAAARRLTRVAFLVIVLCWTGGGIASGDSLTASGYLGRLRE